MAVGFNSLIPMMETVNYSNFNLIEILLEFSIKDYTPYSVNPVRIDMMQNQELILGTSQFEFRLANPESNYFNFYFIVFYKIIPIKI